MTCRSEAHGKCLITDFKAASKRKGYIVISSSTPEDTNEISTTGTTLKNSVVKENFEPVSAVPNMLCYMPFVVLMGRIASGSKRRGPS